MELELLLMIAQREKERLELENSELRVENRVLRRVLKDEVRFRGYLDRRKRTEEEDKEDNQYRKRINW